MNAAGNATYFLFDLHCRNSCGITDGEPGFSVLINFDSSFQIERYIEGAYQLSGRVYLPYFQVQFISVIVDTDELAIIQLSQISYFRRMKRQQKLTKEFTAGSNRNCNSETKKKVTIQRPCLFSICNYEIIAVFKVK